VTKKIKRLAKLIQFNCSQHIISGLTEALDAILKDGHQSALFKGTAFDAIRKLVKYLRAGSKYGHSLGPRFISFCDGRRLPTLSLRHSDFVEFAESLFKVIKTAVIIKNHVKPSKNSSSATKNQ